MMIRCKQTEICLSVCNPYKAVRIRNIHSPQMSHTFPIRVLYFWTTNDDNRSKYGVNDKDN